MKKNLVLSLFALTFCLSLSACNAHNANHLEQNAQTPEPTPSDTPNSITYLNVNGSYLLLSYLEGGVQILSGDIGPYSILMDTRLPDAPPVENFKKIEIPKSHVSASSVERDNTYGLGPIASSGDWDFYPDEVSHQVYTFDNQPDEPKWVSYFKEQLEESNYDGPIVIRESFSFQWNGLETTVVTASNILFSAENSDTYAEEGVCQAATQPTNDVPNIYEISALFVAGRTPETLFQQANRIPKEQEERAEMGLGYVPWDQNYGQYMQYLSAVQYSELGEPSIFPIFCNYNGEHTTRDFKHLLQFAICDIDGDGQSELVMNITRTSSLMCFCKVYKLDHGMLVGAVVIVLN